MSVHKVANLFPEPSITSKNSPRTLPGRTLYTFYVNRGMCNALIRKDRYNRQGSSHNLDVIHTFGSRNGRCYTSCNGTVNSILTELSITCNNSSLCFKKSDAGFQGMALKTMDIMYILATLNLPMV